MSLTPDSALPDLQQTVANLQRQLAGAVAERDEALARETATAEVLGVINSSQGNLAPVFDAMLEKAMRLCGAAIGGIYSYNGEGFEAVALLGVTPAFREYNEKYPMRSRVRPGSLPARMIETRGPVQTSDVMASETYRAGSPHARALAELGGIRAVLDVPLLKEGTLLGFIAIYREEPGTFSDKQIALLENFAAQAVIAMENARLINETREALVQQTATAEVLGVINASPGNLAPVFDAMLQKALHLCESAFGILATYDGEVVHHVAWRGVTQELAEFLREPLHSRPGMVLHRVIQGEDIVQIANMVDDDAYRSGIPGRRALVDLGGARTALLVALRKDKVLLGVLLIFRQEVRPFTDRQIALLRNFASQAVIAMENARLLTETREALEQQTATAEVLQVINASPGDLGPVFDTMLDKALDLCGAAFGNLWTYDDEVFHAAAVRRVPRPYADALSRIRGVSGTTMPGTVLGQIAAGSAWAQILDAAAEEAYSDARAVLELGHARTIAGVALRKDGALVGAITIYRQEVRPFSDKQITLLQNFAAQAVIAMENARLLGELRQRTEEVGELNRDLEARVAEQVDELGRVGRLKRFLAPQLAELIVSQGDEKILESHRREIVVVFCDLRGYTAFTETAEPEEVLDFLREYHGALGPLVSQFEGTLDQFSGDGIMVFFNDPVPIPDPAERAVKMAVAMREAAGTLTIAWRRRGRMLGFGAGIAQGYATLGQIGFADRSGYTAIGTVCNLAARLCAEAKDGQILVAQRVAVAVEETVPLEEVGELTVKGLTQPVVAYNVPLAATQPALRVIEGGPQSV